MFKCDACEVLKLWARVLMFLASKKCKALELINSNFQHERSLEKNNKAKAILKLHEFQGRASEEQIRIISPARAHSNE